MTGDSKQKAPAPGRSGSGGFNIRPALLRWYDRNRRDLPWRRTRDPYRIWLSEVMLQQTTVSVVVDRYTEFLDAFPDVGALARASEEDVLAAWSGLGYYRRARSLHRAARIVAAEHGGRIPDGADTFRALPGVGPYTAGAVLSIAFGARLPVVDGNVARVLARLDAMRGDLSSSAAGKKLWRRAGELLAPRRPGDFNQALMELGALVCLPRNPDCPRCPLKKWCRACARGLTEAIPAPRRKAAPRNVLLAGALIERRGRILLVRRAASETLLRGMWLFPGGEVKTRSAAPRLLERLAGRLLGVHVRVDHDPVAEVPHAITRYRIRLLLHVARPEDRRIPRLPRNGPARWVRPSEIGSLPVSSLVTKGLAARQ